MTPFFVPRTGEIILSDGSKHVLVAGVCEVDDAILNDPAANVYGVKPVHEMTAAERTQHRLPPAAPDVDDSIKVEAKEQASATTDDVKPASEGQARIVAALSGKPEA